MKRWVWLGAFSILWLGACGPPTGDDEMGYRHQAIAHFQVGRLDEAKALLDQSLYPNPGDPVALFYLGRIAFEQRDWEEAIYRFQCCLGADPGHPTARDWLLRAETAAGTVGPRLRFIPLPPVRRVAPQRTPPRTPPE